MKLINKIAKIIKNLSIFILTTLGLVLVVLVGAFGYIFKDDSISIPFLEKIFNDNPIPTEIYDSLSSFEGTANIIFIVAVTIAAALIGGIILYLITLPFVRKKEKKDD